jgi:hypothetical protein
VAGQIRVDHYGYIDAVVRVLKALGIESEGLVSIAPRESKRATGIRLDSEVYWDNDRFNDTFYIDVEWDEELGWTLHNTREPGAVRGYWHDRYGLGLGLVPEPGEVARCVERMFKTELLWDRKHERRKATDYDPELEAALAAYLPT